MCPKTKTDERTEEDGTETVGTGATGAEAFKQRRTITRSGSFPKSAPAPKARPVAPPPKSEPQRSATEESTLIGVQTSKASRYVFVAPRSGKKSPPSSKRSDEDK